MSVNDSQQNLYSSRTNQKGPDEDRSYWGMMIDGIVRPPRANYKNSQLGNKIVSAGDKLFRREDIRVNHGDKHLDVTIYFAASKILTSYASYIILYLHGNSSCRVEALGLLKSIPEGVSLACFDFMGCGKNEDLNTVSLGVRESSQTRTIADFLRKQNFRVILWGRSMGAATALLYGDVEFIVADSSFKSFKSLCKQVAKEHSVVPNCMISCFFPCVYTKIRKDIDKKANYDVEGLDIREAVKNLKTETTVVFLSGQNDTLINKRNSEKLYEACGCNKYLRIFDGDHNSKRPEKVLLEIMGLIEKHILKSREKVLVSNNGVIRIEM